MQRGPHLIWQKDSVKISHFCSRGEMQTFNFYTPTDGSFMLRGSAQSSINIKLDDHW